MTSNTSIGLQTPMTAAIAEVSGLIRTAYPDTEFVIDCDANQEAVYVTAIVDVDDPDEVEDGLPLHVIPVRTPARRDRMLADLTGEPPDRVGSRYVVWAIFVDDLTRLPLRRRPQPAHPPHRPSQ